MVRQLIINADDLGLCRGVNEAVICAHRDGILTSASLMATGPAFEHAVDVVIRENSALGIGAHLCLTSGFSVLGHDEVPLLVRRDGAFRHGFVSLLRLVGRGGAETQEQVERELDAQLSRIRSAGVAIDHINSHRHVHMIPRVFRVVERLAERYGRPTIRVSTERWFPQPWRSVTIGLPRLLRNAPKNVVLRFLQRSLSMRPVNRGNHRVYGILSSGGMDRRTLCATIGLVPEGVSEILTHPAMSLDEPLDGLAAEDRSFLQSVHRRHELDAVMAPGLRAAVARSGIQLVTFGEVASGGPPGSDLRSCRRFTEPLHS